MPPAAIEYERPLPADAMARVMDAIMTGRLPAEEVAAFLTTLARRGETAEELATAVEALRRHALHLPLATPLELCDTCGTGGDRLGTINVSTLAALVAAAAGARVAKHGNRAASSRCGSADLLEALGVNLDASPEQVARSIEEVGFGFCFAPRFHPAMKAVAPVRKALGIRTIFNLIGPLANPARLTFQLVGVSERRLLRPMAEALSRLGIRRGLVVYGADGMDEVTTTGPTDAIELKDGQLAERHFDPTALGIRAAAPEALMGGDPADNAREALEILGGRSSPKRDLVAVNAGCALYCTGVAPTIQAGIAVAMDVMTNGRAQALLERVRERSQPP